MTQVRAIGQVIFSLLVVTPIALLPFLLRLTADHQAQTMAELKRLGVETRGADDGRGIVLEIDAETVDRNAMIAGIKQLKYVKHVTFGACRESLRWRGQGVGMEPVLPMDLACIPTNELESLEIWGRDIADGHVRLLAQPLHLKTLIISSKNVTGECLDHFSKSDLTSLVLRV